MAAPARALLSSRLAGVCAAKVSSCGRRTYSAAAAVARKEPVGAACKARLPGAGSKPREEEGFWMRDPKTGCWMPENRLHDVDAADLRARLLFSKKD
ncbi:hypothetical protein GQ55_6G212800 [Panicum hallii var. hallii]|uniref:Late embryogenesis abundant protein LEA-2 subgroup domain-containing protein n=1 Tax=Panicum hallii var. hallii TaxID=1504633 RepID=A0A2T7D836_9POAL|nr:hypothetical protein GQ55_6G212800 [Panicum hallii var. hallii]